ncbi:hypothetical protein PF005_g24004 [Phytophthora fragariae]|uniref:Crinkler effector protein N-terminal domain-containing protein n=1 Tax=Phytophthora fragariae TaxID=53985 RepID=A0A6A3IGD3_9STRA|nr:hypothetical protein PF009_g26083 [Phytophthora fragariae]KAE8979585.1 hypothetical protein PF011_g22787 [Phytophthora fragariae]KAE9077424.1 hypothetical protein PF010_g23515 [Phytophthora fragariae]KAE9092782.1 hypothetical protein PF006_g24603 [Phytophthora fragariae]KAE9178627.1 hypothetical protein PF005_g24004 [Phytophthora fragariae]
MAKTIRCRLQNGSIVIVEIGEDMTVAHLQQRIKNRAKIALAAYDAHQLTLHLARVNNQWLNTTSGDDVFRQQVQDGNTVMDPDDQTNCCNHCSQVAVPDERANLIERTPVIEREGVATFCWGMRLSKGNASKLAALVLSCAWLNFGLAIGYQVVVTFAPDKEQSVGGVVLAASVYMGAFVFNILIATAAYFGTRLAETED